MEAGVDPALIERQLEEGRLRLLHRAEELQQGRDLLEQNIREYNIAHGYTPIGRPSRMEEVRARGGNLAREIGRDGQTASGHSASYITAPKPVYNSPSKYFRAAEAVAAELPKLSGEMLIRQQARVQELLAAAER